MDPEFAQALEAGRGRASDRRHGEHKARQLCRQVQRALNLALSDVAPGGSLDAVFVDEVTPAPGGGPLLVHVVVPVGRPVTEVLAALGQASPWLRTEVARAVNRKRAPDLSFVPAAPLGSGDV